jgi:trk system potassium uptake protein TrkH
MSFFGAVPYYFSGLGMSFTDALFESSCGFATTGASTIVNIEVLPRSLMLWRGMTHWFGGMGIIVFTIALLPLLGVGGFQLIKAESPGPEKERITPKIASSAKILWLVYIGLTIVLIILLKLGGMEWFDSVIHSFGIMASGGLSTKNAGLAYYNSAAIEIVAAVFMLLAAVNFNIYYRIIRGKWKDAFNNTELRVYLGIFSAASIAIALSIAVKYENFAEAFRHACFYVASFLSTTGAATIDYQMWPAFAQMILFGLMFVGGCSASTAGGIKVIRHAILFKQTGNELRRIIFPTGIFSIHINKKVGRKDVVYGVASFVFVYGMILLVTTLITAASGFDLFSSFSASLAMLGNIGIGFGAVGPGQSYAVFPDHLKLLYSFVMILGRLELWTVLILFHPSFWRR